MKKILLYLSLLAFAATALGCSPQAKWNREQKKAMNDGVETFIKVQRERSIELDALSEKKFKDAGCEIITLTDAERQQWIDKAKEGGVYDLVKSMMDTPEYVDRVLNKDY